MPAGKNICNCPTPPGGQAVCSEDQLAICRIVNGVAYMECVDAPPDAGAPGSQAFNNWVLSAITGTDRSPFDPVSFAEAAIVRRGFYEVPETRETVYFKLPVDEPRGHGQNQPVGA